MTFEIHNDAEGFEEEHDRWSWRMVRKDAPNVRSEGEFASEALARSDIADFKRSCSGRGIRYAKVVAV